MAQAVLGYYARPGMMTSAGAHAGRLAGLPPGIAGAAGVTHGALVHEHLTALYGFSLPDDRRDSVHLRRAERLLERIIAADGRPLDVARPAAERVAGLTADPDATLAPLRALLAEDDRVAVPALVRNALRGRDEPV